MSSPQHGRPRYTPTTAIYWTVLEGEGNDGKVLWSGLQEIDLQDLADIVAQLRNALRNDMGRDEGMLLGAEIMRRAGMQGGMLLAAIAIKIVEQDNDDQ